MVERSALDFSLPLIDDCRQGYDSASRERFANCNDAPSLALLSTIHTPSRVRAITDRRCGVEGIVGGSPTQEVDVFTYPLTRSLRPRPRRVRDCGRAPRS